MKRSVFQVCDLEENASQEIYYVVGDHALKDITNIGSSQLKGENVNHAFTFL
jgi:hypothetical protein